MVKDINPIPASKSKKTTRPPLGLESPRTCNCPTRSEIEKMIKNEISKLSLDVKEDRDWYGGVNARIRLVYEQGTGYAVDDIELGSGSFEVKKGSY